MKKSIFCFTVMLAMLLVLLSGTTGLAMERFDIVTTRQLKLMLDDRNANKLDFILVNALDEIIFRDSSIPGSINLPWAEAEKKAAKLGEDKDKLIITY